MGSVGVRLLFCVGAGQRIFRTPSLVDLTRRFFVGYHVCVPQVKILHPTYDAQNQVSEARLLTDTQNKEEQLCDIH